MFISICARRYCDDKPGQEKSKNEQPEESASLGSMARKYAPFKDEDATEILDVQEERLKYTQMYEERELEEVDPFKGINLESTLFLFVAASSKYFLQEERPAFTI